MAGTARPPTAYDRIMSGRISSGIVHQHSKTQTSAKIIPQPRPPHFLPPLNPKTEFNSISSMEDKPSTQLHLTYQPKNMICRSCQRIILTHTVSSTSRVSVLLASGLCLLGCWCCACLPFCLESMQRVAHSCPKCKVAIGVYHAGRSRGREQEMRNQIENQTFLFKEECCS